MPVRINLPIVGMVTIEAGSDAGKVRLTVSSDQWPQSGRKRIYIEPIEADTFATELAEAAYTARLLASGGKEE